MCTFSRILNPYNPPETVPQNLHFVTHILGPHPHNLTRTVDFVQKGILYPDIPVNWITVFQDKNEDVLRQPT